MRLNRSFAIKVMEVIAADPGRRQRFEQYDNLAWPKCWNGNIRPASGVYFSKPCSGLAAGVSLRRVCPEGWDWMVAASALVSSRKVVAGSEPIYH